MCLKPPTPLAREVAGLFAATGDAPRSGCQPAATAPAPARGSRRQRLWELDHKHHCPIVGTCLSPAELRKLMRRGGRPDVADAGAEFALHVEAAGHAGSRNAVAEAIHKHLDRKYANEIRRFAAFADDAAVLAGWQDRLARGEIAAPLWAALTHPATGAETGQRIYADIHMLSHQLGAGQAADSRRLAWLEAENAELTAAAAREHDERSRSEARLRAELQTQAAHNRQLQLELADAGQIRARLAGFESGLAQVAIGRELVAVKAANAALTAAAERSAALEGELAAARAELRRIGSDLADAEAERDALERLLLPDEDLATNRAATPLAATCLGDCDDCALPGRRILCVGGRTALLAQYRALAERLGIRLVHHDGGQEESVSRLPDLIAGADAVLCPTDCVSHSAYYRLKHQCKRSGKPCLLFRGAGVSSFALALLRIARPALPENSR